MFVGAGPSAALEVRSSICVIASDGELVRLDRQS